jgi:hypothetical protein
MSVIQTVKQSFVKIYNLVQREIAYTQQIDHSGKYIPYFENNDAFPVELSRLVQGSPTATSCLSTLTDFIAGEGFNEGPELENLVINKQGLKFLQLHNICSGAISHNWGVASIVWYNKAGGITDVYDIPFGYCRLGVPDSKGVISKIKYNPYFGTSLYKQKDTVEYDVFNPSQAPVQLAKDPRGYKGQIFWMAIRDEKHPFYPVPDYYSAKHWMNVEKNAGEYFDENLENGFLQSTIIKMLGDPNDASGLKDSNGDDIPKGKAFDTEMTQNFSGVKRVAKIIAMWANGKDEFPTLEAFPTSGNPDMFRIQDEHATKKITIATKVPAILANISEGVSLGGDGNTIRAGVKLMQQRVKRPQSILLDYYAEIFKYFVFPEGFQKPENITIVPYHPFPELETVDPQAWSVLTEQEKRKWVKDHTEIEIIEEVPPADPAPAPTPVVENRIVSLHFNSYPTKAKQNVKRALDWQEKMGKKCSTAFGLKLSQAIMDGVPLGPKEIRRLSNNLSKNMLFKDYPYSESCESVLFDAWGGVDMMIWANEKVKELKGDE